MNNQFNPNKNYQGSSQPQQIQDDALNGIAKQGQYSNNIGQFQNNNNSDDQENMQLRTDFRDVILENDMNGQRYLMPKIEVKFLVKENSLFFSDLVDRLKQMNFPLHECMLFCWDDNRKMHVFVATDPIERSLFLSSNLYGIQNNVFIKFRSKQQPQQQQQYANGQNKTQTNNQIVMGNGQQTSQINFEDQIAQDENTNFSHQNNEISMTNDSKLSRKKKVVGGRQQNDKRVKERKIEHVRQQVAEWRAMNTTGIREKDGSYSKITLDQAANHIGISRKTLDDYSLQLRRAEQFGFDFERNKDGMMGILRKFVKEQQKNFDKNQGNGNTLQNNDNHMNINTQLGCDNSDGEESSQDINCQNSNTPSNMNTNSNPSCNPQQQNNQQSPPNQLIELQTSNPNRGSLITPFQNTNQGGYPYSSGGLNAHNSYGLNNQNSTMQNSIGHFSQNNRNSCMIPELMGSGLDQFNRNSNYNNSMNLSFANNVFNPGSQFQLNNGNGASQFGNPNFGSDFNNILGEGMNQGSNLTDQRFSQQFFITTGFPNNNSQIMEERSSQNFLNSGLNNQNSLIRGDNRQSNGSFHNMDDQLITRHVNYN